MSQNYDLEAARFFMKLEKMLNELEDEKEIASRNLETTNIHDISHTCEKNDNKETPVKMLDKNNISYENKKNFNPLDYV
jgi:hypothetical protein